jgi:chemotaxis protein histidine kinase CheA
MEDFRRQFLTEAAENLRALIEDWQKAEAIYNSVRRGSFRTLHTIKGTAQTFGYNSSSRLAHELENLLLITKNEKTAESENSKSLFLEGIGLLIKSLERKDYDIPASFTDRVQDLIPAASAQEEKDVSKNLLPDIPIEFLSQLSTQEKKAIRAARADKKNIFCFEVGFETAKFADELINFREILCEAGEIIATLPGAKFNHDGKIGFQILFASLADTSEIEAIAEAGTAEVIFNSSPVIFSNDGAGVLAQIVEHGKETAEKIGKRIRFKTSAVGIKLSPRRLKLIFDVLLHLVRNAVDHAVETSGQIEIHLKTDENRLRLIVSDDGRGIDSERIKAKAVEQNLISGEKILTAQEALDLIFLPELSTKSAAATDEISGRGIGLDAVKFEIEKVGGKISVVSQSGKGATFEIVLPRRENRTAQI